MAYHQLAQTSSQVCPSHISGTASPTSPGLDTSLRTVSPTFGQPGLDHVRTGVQSNEDVPGAHISLQEIESSSIGGKAKDMLKQESIPDMHSKQLHNTLPAVDHYPRFCQLPPEIVSPTSRKHPIRSSLIHRAQAVPAEIAPHPLDHPHQDNDLPTGPSEHHVGTASSHQSAIHIDKLPSLARSDYGDQIKISTSPLSSSGNLVGGERKSNLITEHTSSISSRSWSYGSDKLAHILTELKFPHSAMQDEPLNEHVVSSSARKASPSSAHLPPPPLHHHELGDGSEGLVHESSARVDHVAEPSRAATPNSVDNEQRPDSLFVGFDGVHYLSQRPPSTTYPMSTVQAPESSNAQHPDQIARSNGPPSDPNRVFYPAPVPTILRLPPKLSKLPSAAERERRRRAALSAMPDHMRKSAVWLKEDTAQSSATRRSQASGLKKLPPQLRASAFFEQLGTTPHVNAQGASPTEALEMMLEASAYAPVTAFTDHPYTERLNADMRKQVQRRDKKRASQTQNDKSSSNNDLLGAHHSSHLNARQLRTDSFADSASLGPSTAANTCSDGMLGQGRTSPLNGQQPLSEASSEALSRTASPSGNQLQDDSVEATQAPGDEDRDERGEDQDSDDDVDSESVEFDGPPITLLAELQMRKAQQKRRNKTAATAFPNGMRSTLLELDAVTQVQQTSRKKTNVKLAWEDGEATGSSNVDDEDIPLGLLVGGGDNARQSMIQPFGLVQQQVMEENEPLSSRRVRLKGMANNASNLSFVQGQRASTAHIPPTPSAGDPILDQEEDETLAQRIRRIKAEDQAADTALSQSAPISADISGVRSEVVVPSEPHGDAEETLGRRRQRLRNQALKDSRHPSAENQASERKITARTSMADILSQHPIRAPRQSSSEIPPFHPSSVRHQGGPKPYLMNGIQSSPSMTAHQSFPSNIFSANPAGSFYQNNFPGYNPYFAMHPAGQNLAPDRMMDPLLDAHQRDMIDRWRQDVAP